MSTSLSDKQVEALKARAIKKARMVEVLDRGIVNDRLLIPNVPDNLHYEWVHDDTESIAEMEGKGFWIDKEYSHKRALHNDGTTTGRIGDVICMMCSKEDHELIEEIRTEKAFKNSGSIGGKQLEERQFRGNALAAGLTPIIDEASSSQVVGAEEIQNAVRQTST